MSLKKSLIGACLRQPVIFNVADDSLLHSMTSQLVASSYDDVNSILPILPRSSQVVFVRVVVVRLVPTGWLAQGCEPTDSPPCQPCTSRAPGNLAKSSTLGSISSEWKNLSSRADTPTHSSHFFTLCQTLLNSICC